MTIPGSLIGISLAFICFLARFLFIAAIPAVAAATIAISNTASVVTSIMNMAMEKSVPSCFLLPASSCTSLKTRPGNVGLIVGGRVGKVGMVVVGLCWVVGKVGGVVGGRVGRVAGVDGGV